MRSSLNIASFEDIRQRADALKAENPKMRARDAAETLGCSEAEWVGCGAANEVIYQLDTARIQDWLGQITTSGKWMWLLRNDSAVLEVDAEATLRANPGQLKIRTEQMQVELDIMECRYAFYIGAEKGPPRSVQIFDPSGVAVLKIYLKDRKRREACDEMLKPHALRKPLDRLVLETATTPALVPLGEGGEIAKDSYRKILETARDAKESVTLKAANNGGELQVSHIPERLEPMGPWYNILDQGLNLHLQEGLIESAYREEAAGEVRAVFLSGKGQRYLTLSFAKDSRIAQELS